MLKKLPLGIQTFEKISSDDYLYVDKTQLAYDLISNSSYVFLARPRRFGKSLFLDTIHNIFEGNKEYFKALSIYHKWDWETKYPVIKISFAGEFKNKETTELIIKTILDSNKRRLNLDFEVSSNISVYFKKLIFEVNKKYNQKVVILVDEYDKAILDNINNIELANEIRDTLKGFYTQIKDNDELIKFCMLTGVSKFSKVSIFSGLNNLLDISLDKKYASICGYTQNDLETSFKEYLIDVDMERLKSWYNGYNFLGEKVYNPYDILQFLHFDKKFSNYWFKTGTPSFLIALLKKNQYFLPRINSLEVEEDVLDSFDIENLKIETIMFQAGYLTIKEEIEEFGFTRYSLCFPNQEVKNSFSNNLASMFIKDDEKTSLKVNTLRALSTNNFEEIEKEIKRLFASIAYNNFTNNEISSYEGFYASVVYSYFAALGLELIAEDVTNKGRIDLTIKFDNRVYVIEFKINSKNALTQIKEKKYYEKYLSSDNEVYIIGICFDTKDRNVNEFDWELI